MTSFQVEVVGSIPTARSKLCTRCNKQKELSEFASRKGTKDGKAYACKACHIKYSARHYTTNKRSYVLQSKKQRSTIQEKLLNYKGQRGCANCSEKRPWVLDFHHPDPSIKDGDVAFLKGKGNWKLLEREIAKCVVVCRNCHADIHYQQLIAG